MKINVILLIGLLIFNSGTSLSYPGESLVDFGKNTCNSLYERIIKSQKPRRIVIAALSLIAAISIGYAIKLDLKRESLVREDVKNYDEIIKQLQGYARSANWGRTDSFKWVVDYEKVYERYCSSPEIIRQLKIFRDEISKCLLVGILSLYPLFVLIPYELTLTYYGKEEL